MEVCNTRSIASLKFTWPWEFSFESRFIAAGQRSFNSLPSVAILI